MLWHRARQNAVVDKQHCAPVWCACAYVCGCFNTAGNALPYVGIARYTRRRCVLLQQLNGRYGDTRQPQHLRCMVRAFEQQAWSGAVQYAHASSPVKPHLAEVWRTGWCEVCVYVYTKTRILCIVGMHGVTGVVCLNRAVPLGVVLAALWCTYCTTYCGWGTRPW